MINDELEAAYLELAACRKKVAAIQKKSAGETVKDYAFKDAKGKPVRLADLFGGKSDLVVVHNMGKSCPYCTLWADGFNGVYRHLENRAGFAVVSPDKFEVMAEFADGRGWKFRMLSNDGGDFTNDMGFEDNGRPQPGVSSFHRDDKGAITRVSRAVFGPGDEFCVVWHMFEMLRDGVDGWQPKYKY
jgi:predicted dithiol-disulfide oxidoreductase (DUF899 family)